MDATPFEHVLVVAVAAKLTVELTVAPFDGLLTTTVANAGAAKARRSKGMELRVFMNLPQPRIKAR
jgi:hypothetical protein